MTEGGRGPTTPAPSGIVQMLRSVRQIRQYAPDPVPAEIVEQILDVARWTGSAVNSQPWHFIVVRDRVSLVRLSALRAPIEWLATAPLGIAIVLSGASPIAEAYDEGRVTERILTAANALGLGAGVAWFGTEEHQTAAKRILGVPADRTARSIVMIGRALSRRDPRPGARARGRKARAEVVSYDRWGSRT